MAVGIASWGVLGVALLLVRALHQLTPLALEPIVSRSLGFPHWGLLLGWVAFNAYAEGYVGFHTASGSSTRPDGPWSRAGR